MFISVLESCLYKNLELVIRFRDHFCSALHQRLSKLVLYNKRSNLIFNLIFLFVFTAPAKNFEVAFKVFDINGDGVVEYHEFDQVGTIYNLNKCIIFD